MLVNPIVLVLFFLCVTINAVNFVLVRVSSALLKTMIKRNMRRKVFLLAYNSHVTLLAPREVRTGTHGRTLEARTGTEAMKKCCLLGCFPLLAQCAS